MTTFNQKESFPYGFYLFGRLAIDMGLISKTLEYDIAYETTLSLYLQFVDSEFNDFELSEYDCIIDYIKYQLEL